MYIEDKEISVPWASSKFKVLETIVTVSVSPLFYVSYFLRSWAIMASNNFPSLLALNIFFFDDSTSYVPCIYKSLLYKFVWKMSNWCYQPEGTITAGSCVRTYKKNHSTCCSKSCEWNYVDGTVRNSSIVVLARNL